MSPHNYYHGEHNHHQPNNKGVLTSDDSPVWANVEASASPPTYINKNCNGSIWYKNIFSIIVQAIVFNVTGLLFSQEIEDLDRKGGLPSHMGGVDDCRRCYWMIFQV